MELRVARVEVGDPMQTVAVVLDGPQQIAVRSLALNAVRDDDVVIDVSWSGISTGTERLLWTGRMPPFPGMGYPLVPGYESVGRVVDAGAKATHRIGHPLQKELLRFLFAAVPIGRGYELLRFRHGYSSE